MKIAIVGAGWSGLSCAIELVESGHEVSVFEASPQVGGRAKTILIKDTIHRHSSCLEQSQSDYCVSPEHNGWRLDNGQHILIGAYQSCWQLMKKIGLDIDLHFHRSCLSMHFPDGKGLQFPNCLSPWNALFGIFTVKGWSLKDKFSLLQACTRWQLAGFKCDPGCSVLDLSKACSPKVLEELIEPICISALNIASKDADGQVFLNVIKDTLFAGFGASDFLIPYGDLSHIFAEPAKQWLEQKSCQVLTHHRVTEVIACPGPDNLLRWQLQLSKQTWDDTFDHVVLACNANHAAHIVSDSMKQATTLSSPNFLPCSEESREWLRICSDLKFNSISTVYIGYEGSALPSVMMALRSNATEPAQFVFDQEQIGGPAGILAFVVSASQTFNLNNAELGQAVLKQAQSIFKDKNLELIEVVTEKKATFSCHVGHVRPSTVIATQLWACGDYVHEKYPATLEAAVQNGQKVARQIIATTPGH